LSVDGVNPDPGLQEVLRLRKINIDLEGQIAEARRASQRLAVRDAVTMALAESSSLEGAAPRIVRTVCEALGWQFGALWTVEPHDGQLHCVEMWHSSTGTVPQFESATSRRRFSRGVGMPGRVWASAKPAWIPDVTTDDNFPRAEIAAQEGLRASLGFPIIVGTECVGVLEFFSGEIQQPDDELLQMLGALGSQIGQFVERKRAENELRRYFTLSLDMLCIANYSGYFVRLNPAWERTLGYSVGEMMATPFIDFVHPDDRVATLTEMERLSRGEDTISFENRYLAKDGSYRWMLWNATPFGQEQLIYAAARDITERKRAEEKIHRLRDEAESANRAKSEFLARMSHEIRTPLNVVIGMGDVLERTGLNSEQRQYLRVSQKAGNDLLVLINDLLDLSKAEAGRITLEEIDFDLLAVTDALIEMMSMRARVKGIELTSEILSGVPSRLRGDPDRLRQVLVNLVNNAIKFTPQGKVALRIEPESRESPRILRFSVSDTGIGIPSDKLDSIFEAFSQADASTTRKYGGTGLGLTISKRLVERMGGRMWVESRPSCGSTFYFVIPFEDPGPVAVVPSTTPAEFITAQEANLPSNLRILVVDDSEDNRFLITAYLKDFGCQIESAENGQIAVEKFCEGDYALVLMDLQMPVLDGFAATRRIRDWEQEQRRHPTPIIALTASALDAELQGALDAGCTAYLRKPVRLLTLLQAVAEHAGKVASTRAVETDRITIRADARLRAVIPGYLQNRRRDIRAILEALDRSDYETVRELGHKMSGSGSGYGFPRVTEIGRSLEDGGRERNPEQIRKSVVELRKYLDQIEVV
jgi:PAS domain S-box-containing protein